eukprot:11880659-Alexandrium_andersonii.AAC.1
MSASLVGSEMCIRDRSCPACAHRDVKHGAPHVLSKSTPRVPYMSRPCAVSYTHLTLPTICSV